MVINVINIVGISLLETKDDAPVGPDSNAPEVPKIACQAMQSEAGQVHAFRLAGSVENGEDVFYFLSVISSDPLGFSLFKQPP